MYEQQARGARSAYERYLAGMDTSMRQKVALTAAHLLAQGTVADMGMGSGAGSFALASLYPSLDVVGVDVNPTMVELAREKYRLPNLSFVTGDIATECFPAASLDGIFDSSVLHHVTTFTGYDYDAAERALEAQVRQLRTHGTLIVRDFLDPGSGAVVLELPARDGDDSEEPRTCSTASLFVRFAREFRKLDAAPGFAFEELEPRDGVRRFRIPLKLAAEFVLRKDYRADWDTEVLEEYTYFTQARFEAIYARLGLRLLASTPLWNPWIVRHRYEGKFVLRDAAGDEVEPPPTNYLIAGEKVGPGEGVRFEEGAMVPPPGFLELQHHRNRVTGLVMDLVRRPHPTVDVLPWFESGGEVFVLARKSYPRPILSGAAQDALLDSSTPPQYVTEPLNVLQQEKPLGTTVTESLAAIAGIAAEGIRSFREGSTYYPSPGGVEEEVRSALVEIEPAFVQTPIEGVSGFSTSGYVRAIEATQLLRASQVGGVSDARIEVNVYRLLQLLGRAPGPWIGDEVALRHEARVEAAGLDALLAAPPRRHFEPAPPAASSGFLELRCSTYVERDAAGAAVAQQALESVVPRTLSVNTIVTALLVRSGEEVLIGVDDDDLPAAQSFTGNSNLLVAPAWRLPRTVRRRRDARAWIEERLRREYALEALQWAELGGKYHPSPGITPERCHPFAVEVRPGGEGERRLHWVRLRELASRAGAVHDGHLRVVLFRAAHALGLLQG
jgi:SAM-dependent methyltransferase